MLKRLHIYFKEMYPIIPRLLPGLIIFGEIYFIVLLNNGVTQFQIGGQKIIGGFTVFSFLLWLRIADDFKDYELDCRLFSHRPLPSGRVKKKDLAVFPCADLAGNKRIILTANGKNIYVDERYGKSPAEI